MGETSDQAFHRAFGAAIRGDLGPATALVQSDPGFVAWLAENRIGPLLYDLAVPGSAVRKRLKSQRVLAAVGYVRQSAWVGALIDAATERGLDVIAFKGAGIAHHPHVYRLPELRVLGDLDLLIESSALEAFAALAGKQGFSLSGGAPESLAFARDHYQLQLAHPTHGVLELHHQLYRDVPTSLTLSMLELAEAGVIYGRRVLRLRDPDLFLVLSAHLAQNEYPFPAIWVLDLLRLGEAFSPADWEQVRRSAQEWGQQIFVLAALAYMESLWAASPRTLPPGFSSSLERALSRREVRALASLRRGLQMGGFSGDVLRVARRLSGRPMRGRRSVLRSILCRPEAVAVETGVGMDQPGFTLARVRHAAGRIRRGLRAWRATRT